MTNPKASFRTMLEVFRLKPLRTATVCLLALAGLAQTQQSQPAQSTPQPAPPSGQQPKTTYESSMVLKITSRLVVVDVVAVDHKGQPVNDLTADDFTILEEGKEQKVSVFSFQHPTPSAEGNATPSMPAKLPAHLFSNIPSRNTRGTLNVVLLDALNTSTNNQAFAREQMLKLLARIPAGQPVAVYTLTLKLRLLQDFTSDPAALKEAIAHLKDKASPLLNNPTGSSEIPFLLPGIFDAMGMVPGMQQHVQQFAAEEVSMQTDVRVRLTLDALNSIARTLSGYPRRKNLIWLSETFPLSISPDSNLGPTAYSAWRDYRSQVAATANLLTDAEVAVYPIDVKALANSSVYSVGNNNYDNMGRSTGGTLRGSGLGTELSKQSDENLAYRDTMNDIAERTGGKAFYNRNDIDNSILKSIEDGSTYYTLGYNPENKDWNGRFRQITVKSRRSGTKLRYRLGYFAVDPKNYAKVDARQRAIDLGQALSVDFPISTALPFRVLVNPPSAKTDNRVLIDYAIDPHAISFEHQEDGLEHASWDCAAIVYSTKGAVVKQDGRGMTARMNPDEFRKTTQSFVPCRQTFDLPPGDYYLRVAVRDNTTGLIGTANASLTVPLEPSAAKPDDKKPQ